ncbi:ATP-binding protein [Candidatus Dependentiae bacterium]|nr:ATP-binding protein [Candidatus Dependentiae bacterium]
MYKIGIKNKVLSLSILLLLCSSLYAGGDNNSNGGKAEVNGAGDVLRDAGQNIGNLMDMFGNGANQLFGALGNIGGNIGDAAGGVVNNAGVQGVAGAAAHGVEALFNSPAMRWMGSKMAAGLEAGIDFAAAQAEKFQQENLAKVAKLRQKLESRYLTAGERQDILERIDELKEAAKKNRERLQETIDNANKAAFETYQAAITTAQDYAKQSQLGNQKLQRAAVNAEANKEAAIEKTKAIIAAVTDKSNIKKAVVASTVLILSYYTIKYGSALAHDAIKHYYRNPTLSTDTTLINPLQAAKQKLVSKITGIEPKKSSVKDVILEPELAKRVDVLDKSIQNTVKNGAPFGNILFYGPPGTGKTMLAKRLALNSGLEYIYFTASALEQYSLEEGLIKLTELFEFAKRSSKKLMIVIDEAEKLFANRSNQVNDKTGKLLTHVLGYTGTESYDFMVVALTNRPQDLDKAFLSRCDDRIKIDAPGFEQRRAIIKKYFTEYLFEAAKPLVVPKNRWGTFVNWLDNKPQPARRITIDKAVLTADFINQLTEKTDGFVGRDISKMVIAILKATYVSDDAHVTPELVNQIAAVKIAERATENTATWL